MFAGATGAEDFRGHGEQGESHAQGEQSDREPDEAVVQEHAVPVQQLGVAFDYGPITRDVFENDDSQGIEDRGPKAVQFVGQDNAEKLHEI